MADGPFDPETGQLIPRPPQREDLVRLCRELEKCGAEYVVVGGFAVIMIGLPRTTGDIDLVDAPESVPKLTNDRVRELLADFP